MSLELALQANTDALKAFTEALLATGIASASSVAALPKAVKAVASGPATAKVVVAAVPVSTTAESAPAAASVAAAVPASTAATEAITYDQVAKAITDGVKADRVKVVAALAQFGAKKGTELKAEQYADFLAAL